MLFVCVCAPTVCENAVRVKGEGARFCVKMFDVKTSHVKNIEKLRAASLYMTMLCAAMLRSKRSRRRRRRRRRTEEATDSARISCNDEVDNAG